MLKNIVYTCFSHNFQGTVKDIEGSLLHAALCALIMSTLKDIKTSRRFIIISLLSEMSMDELQCRTYKVYDYTKICFTLTMIYFESTTEFEWTPLSLCRLQLNALQY